MLQQEVIDCVVGSEACFRLVDSFSSPEHEDHLRRERALFKQLKYLDELVSSFREDAAYGIDFRKTSNGLFIAHLNVRSLLPKISEIRLLCSELKLSVLGCSETWLDGSILDSEIDIANYNLIRRDRNRKGGGVCVFVRSDLMFNIRNDLDSASIEVVWMDILLPKSKPILVGSLYRPPDQRDFYELLEGVLNDCLKHHDSEVIICGDLNTDMLKSDSVM